MARFLRTFLAGVLALLPIAVTVFVTAWVGSLVASYAGPGSFVGRHITALGSTIGLNIEPSSPAAYLLGLAIIIGAIFLLGVLVESGTRSFISNRFRFPLPPRLSRLSPLGRHEAGGTDRPLCLPIRHFASGILGLSDGSPQGPARIFALSNSSLPRR